MARSSPKPPPIRRPCRAIHDRRQPATAASSIGPGAGMVSRVDAYQRRHRWAGLPLAVLYKFADDQGTYLAAQITYYGFVALFPLLLLLATLLGYALHDNQHLQRQVLDSALAQFPVIGDQIVTNIRSFHGSIVGLVIGILGCVYGGPGSRPAAPTQA